METIIKLSRHERKCRIKKKKIFFNLSFLPVLNSLIFEYDDSKLWIRILHLGLFTSSILEIKKKKKIILVVFKKRRIFEF